MTSARDKANDFQESARVVSAVTEDRLPEERGREISTLAINLDTWPTHLEGFVEEGSKRLKFILRKPSPPWSKTEGRVGEKECIFKFPDLIHYL